MRVFISYRRQDSGLLVDRLYHTLAQAFGADNVFRDIDSIPLGTDFREAVRRAVEQADVTLAVIGAQWSGPLPDGKRRLDEANDLVRLEIEAALKVGKLVVPLLTPGGAIPSVAELPEAIRDITYRNGMPLRPDPDFATDTARLVKSLRGLQEPTVPAPPAEALKSPVQLRNPPYTILRTGERHVIAFNGSFVSDELVSTIRQELVEYLQANDVRQVTLNLQGVRTASSTMLGVFLRIFRHVQTVGGDLVTIHVPPTLEELFRILRIDKILGLPPGD